MEVSENLERVVGILGGLPPRAGESEAALHGRIRRALTAGGVPYAHEVRLIQEGVELGRVDFLCEGGIGIEAKVGNGSRARLLAQAESYLRSEHVEALIVVTERRAPGWLSEGLAEVAEEAGKPVKVLALATGVAC